jgi:hypothetical protein
MTRAKARQIEDKKMALRRMGHGKALRLIDHSISRRLPIQTHFMGCVVVQLRRNSGFLELGPDGDILKAIRRSSRRVAPVIPIRWKVCKSNHGPSVSW